MQNKQIQTLDSVFFPTTKEESIKTHSVPNAKIKKKEKNKAKNKKTKQISRRFL